MKKKLTPEEAERDLNLQIIRYDENQLSLRTTDYSDFPVRLIFPDTLPIGGDGRVFIPGYYADQNYRIQARIQGILRLNAQFKCRVYTGWYQEVSAHKAPLFVCVSPAADIQPIADPAADTKPIISTLLCIEYVSRHVPEPITPTSERGIKLGVLRNWRRMGRDYLVIKNPAPELDAIYAIMRHHELAETARGEVWAAMNPKITALFRKYMTHELMPEAAVFLQTNESLADEDDGVHYLKGDGSAIFPHTMEGAQMMAAFFIAD